MPWAESNGLDRGARFNVKLLLLELNFISLDEFVHLGLKGLQVPFQMWTRFYCGQKNLTDPSHGARGMLPPKLGQMHLISCLDTLYKRWR